MEKVYKGGKNDYTPKYTRRYTAALCLLWNINNYTHEKGLQL